jgi:hypothetical protein
MKKQHTKLWIVLMILLVLNLIGTGTVLYKLYAPSSSKEQTEYELYIGTNDKDTYQSEIPYDECVSKVTDICLDHVDGFTALNQNSILIEKQNTEDTFYTGK